MLSKPQILSYAEKPVTYTVHNSTWIPCSAKFSVVGGHSSGNGIIQLYELADGDVKLIQEDVKQKPLKCCTFGASSLRNREIAVGDFDGGLKIWSVENLDKYVYSVNAHAGIVNCIDGVGGNYPGYGAPEIVTGGIDGTVKVWDPRQKGKPVALMEPATGLRRDCWSVAFGNSYNSEERVVVAGYDNGDIKLFDLKNMSLRWETHVPNGVCCVEFDKKETKMNKLLATTVESKFHIFDLRNNEKEVPHITEKLEQPGTVWLGRHLPQKRDIFATCTGSNALCIWKYHYSGSVYGSESGSDVELLQSNAVGQQATSSFAWCPEKIGLALHTAFDETIRLLIVTKLNLQ